MTSEPLILPRNCGNCQNFDGDAFCALPHAKVGILISPIYQADKVVCVKHEPKEADDEG